MGTHLRHEYFGQYRLVRPQGSFRGLDRWVLLDERTNTNHMLYRFAPSPDNAERRRVFNAVHTISSARHAHLLRIESVSFDDHNRLCVITPYTGNQDGLVTLRDLLEVRDGKLEPAEAIRCLTHLLQAAQAAHNQGVVHGAISSDEILVDRRGSVQIECYGLEFAMHPPSDKAAIASDEVRSIVGVGYTMLVGLEPGGDERLAPSRVVRKLDRLWDRWFMIGLDPVEGFASPHEALRMLPTMPGAAEAMYGPGTPRPQVQIGSVLRRFRSAGSRTRP